MFLQDSTTTQEPVIPMNRDYYTNEGRCDYSTTRKNRIVLFNLVEKG